MQFTSKTGMCGMDRHCQEFALILNTLNLQAIRKRQTLTALSRDPQRRPCQLHIVLQSLGYLYGGEATAASSETTLPLSSGKSIGSISLSVEAKPCPVLYRTLQLRSDHLY